MSVSLLLGLAGERRHPKKRRRMGRVPPSPFSGEGRPPRITVFAAASIAADYEESLPDVDVVAVAAPGGGGGGGGGGEFICQSAREVRRPFLSVSSFADVSQSAKKVKERGSISA